MYGQGNDAKRNGPTLDHPCRSRCLLCRRRAADNPELRGKPVMVGGRMGRGVVAAASYEAREFGIHAAMPGRRATPVSARHLLEGSYRKYQAESARVMSILSDYSPTVETLSIDEAFLDATGLERWKGGRWLSLRRSGNASAKSAA